MALWASIIVFAVFAINVAMGSFSNNAFLNDVGEMLTLFAAAVLFVIAILRKEAAAKQK